VTFQGEIEGIVKKALETIANYITQLLRAVAENIEDYFNSVLRPKKL